MAQSCIEHWIKWVCDVIITPRHIFQSCCSHQTSAHKTEHNVSNTLKYYLVHERLYPNLTVGIICVYSYLLAPNSQISLPYTSCKLASSGAYEGHVCLCVWIQFNRSLNSALTTQRLQFPLFFHSLSSVWRYTHKVNCISALAPVDCQRKSTWRQSVVTVLTVKTV